MWDKRPSCDAGQNFHTEIKAGTERFEQQTQQRGKQVLVPQICHRPEEPRARNSSSYCPTAPSCWWGCYCVHGKPKLSPPCLLPVLASWQDHPWERGIGMGVSWGHTQCHSQMAFESFWVAWCAWWCSRLCHLQQQHWLQLGLSLSRPPCPIHPAEGTLSPTAAALPAARSEAQKRRIVE